MQALVDNYQCLACGALTAMDSHTVVPSDIPNVVTSPSGHPVKELSTTAPVVLAPAGPPEADSEPATEPDRTTEPAEELDGIMDSHPIDISALTPEQIEELREELGV